jgi:hypothetical protein
MLTNGARVEDLDLFQRGEGFKIVIHATHVSFTQPRLGGLPI